MNSTKLRFFTRQFRPDVRPVADPANDKIIVSAWEASPYNVRHDVKLHDQFWVISRPYSLQEIFTASQQRLAPRRLGLSGVSFLSAYNHHRWHAPVSGTIAQTYLIDGTYYSDAESEGVDPGGLNDVQGYTTAIAARAVIVIDCDEPAIGQVGCVFVGMAEGSSCVVEALRGQRVKKGKEIDYFQYGGSTYCLIFELGVSIASCRSRRFTTMRRRSRSTDTSRRRNGSKYISRFLSRGRI